MSDTAQNSPTTGAPAAPPQWVPPAISAGTLLRQAREAQGLHIESLAASLKMSVAKLQALEADNFVNFPDVSFVRVFAASVCRSLKVDAAPILAALPPSAELTLGPYSEGINAKLRDERNASIFSLLGGKRITLAVVALLLGALWLFFLPQRTEPDATTPEGDTPVVEAPAEAAPAAPPPAPIPEPAPPSSAVAAPAPSLPLPAKAPEVLTAPKSVLPPVPTPVPNAVPVEIKPPLPKPPENTAPVAPVALVAPVSAATPAPALPDGVVVFNARASSWIHVRNPKGATVLQRVLASGESVAITHPPPLSVVVGRADMTDVYVRGARFDIAALSKENIAKFEVK